LVLIIVYQSFEGEFGDSPRALFERWRRRRPDHTHVWLSGTRTAGHFPADVATVPIYTAESTALLEEADVLVANTHTDTDWCKRPDAFYLQTWHGTPLKRVHHDVRWAPDGRLARLDHDIARWDMLVSPNAVSTERLRGAFRFTGPVIETGYPRNDVLLGPERDRIRADVRAALGLPPATTAILYTPTWRDDHVFGAASGTDPVTASLPAVLDRLEDGEVLLFRCHSLAAAKHIAAEHPRVLDVSSWPEVAELYLAADVMVTDYSSTMFDFAVTGKPLLHFVPDYERFRDEVRGFYFDLEPEAPGPLYRNADELLGAIRAAGSPDPGYARRYAAFRGRYCDLEDGHATDRVLAAVEAAVPGAVEPDTGVPA
jgi:CDP-glycerol glycerophosphotransferase